MGEITVGKTKNARRDILLPAHALRVIEEQKEMLKEYGIATRTWLFPSPNGDKMDTNALYKQWIHYGSQHGINSTLHELRHTTVSLVKTELPEDLLNQMICHSESMDTGRYKHRTEEDLEKGYLEVANRKNIMEEFPLTSISIGVVIVQAGRFHNILEIGELGAQVKHIAKTIMGSSYAIDRRK